jgi:hypothetical protein
MEREARVLAARLQAQLLTDRRGRSPLDVVRQLLAVQAQDARGARLAIRARSVGLISADVDEALNRGELVISWLNRGTLHLVGADDYWWLHQLTTPQLVTGNARRLRQEGVSERDLARAIEVVTIAVTEGPRTRAELRSHLDAAGIPTGGQALVHILVAATLQGLIVRGPMIGTEQAFVSVESWLGRRPPPMQRTEAVALLASRYLVAHAPASDADLAKWAGITLAEARTGLAAATPGRSQAAEDLPPPRLLGSFDPLLHGWKSRTPVVGEPSSMGER